MDITTAYQTYNIVSNAVSQFNASNIYDAIPKNSSLTQIVELSGGVGVGIGFIYLMQALSSKIARFGGLWAGGKMASETCERLSNTYNSACPNWTNDFLCAAKMTSQGIACGGEAMTNLFLNNLPLPSSETIYNTVSNTTEMSKIVYDRLAMVPSTALIPAGIIGGVGGTVCSGLYFLKSAGLKTLHLGALWVGERVAFEACTRLSENYEATCPKWDHNAACVGKKGAAAVACGAETAFNLVFMHAMAKIANGILPERFRPQLLEAIGT